MLTNDTTHVILALNTGKGVHEEIQLLTKLGLAPLKVLISHCKGHREPAYLVEDILEALATAYEYNQETVTMLKGDQASVIGVITGGILAKGTWHKTGHIEPERGNWMYDQETDSYYTIGE